MIGTIYSNWFDVPKDLVFFLYKYNCVFFFPSVEGRAWMDWALDRLYVFGVETNYQFYWFGPQAWFSVCIDTVLGWLSFTKISFYDQFITHGPIFWLAECTEKTPFLLEDFFP